MLSPEQIRKRALNRYEAFLRSLCTNEVFFPLVVYGAGFAKPKDFAGDRAAIQALRQSSKEKLGFGYEITWEQRTYRRLGAQSVPSGVSFPSRDDYVRFLKADSEVARFESDYATIGRECSELVPWAQERPLKVVAHAGAWIGLLKVCNHLKDHPRPNCYLRELAVPVDTKFIERHINILSELLPVVAPATVGLDNSRFETRFGFRYRQPLVRLRFLDEALKQRLGFPLFDFAVPLDVFRGFGFQGHTVLIVENDMTFLTLPKLPETAAIFGSGDAAALLTSVDWLERCELFYWGDLDVHGFETLSNLRQRFPRTISVLMDETTLEEHRAFAVKATESRSAQPRHLTPTEAALYKRLAGEEMLLEQERIPLDFTQRQLQRVIVR